jgi:hypothetical protein
MKKLVLVAIILIANLNLTAQKIYYTSKKGDNIDKMKPFYSIVTINDSTIEIKVSVSSQSFKIQKKIVLEQQVLYRLTDDNQDLRKELLIVESLNHMELTTGINRLDGFQVVSKNIFSISKVPASINPQSGTITRSFGAVAGFSTVSSLYSGSYGVYIDFGHVGFEYHASASVSNESPDAFINGQTNKYVGGNGTTNIGFFSKLSPRTKGSLYLGLGAQFFTEVSAKTQQSFSGNNTFSYSTVSQESKTVPYLTIGHIQKLGEKFSTKIGLIFSESTMINFGFGYNF